MSDDEQGTARRIAEATQAALQAEHLMPTRLVVVAEVINDEGEREFWTATTPGLKVWDSLGLLHMAIARENASLVGNDDA